MSEQRVRITTNAIGTIRIHDPYHFTPYIIDAGATGIVVDSESLPEGWLLVRLDDPDPEPADDYSDGHLYVPVHPSMIEVVS